MLYIKILFSEFFIFKKTKMMQKRRLTERLLKGGDGLQEYRSILCRFFLADAGDLQKFLHGMGSFGGHIRKGCVGKDEIGRHVLLLRDLHPHGLEGGKQVGTPHERRHRNRSFVFSASGVFLPFPAPLGLSSTRIDREIFCPPNRTEEAEDAGSSVRWLGFVRKYPSSSNRSI